MRLNIVPNPITYSNARRSAVVAGHAVSGALVIRAILAGHINAVISGIILRSRVIIRINFFIIRINFIIEPVNNIVHSIDPKNNGHITGNFYSSK